MSTGYNIYPNTFAEKVAVYGSDEMEAVYNLLIECDEYQKAAANTLTGQPPKHTASVTDLKDACATAAIPANGLAALEAVAKAWKCNSYKENGKQKGFKHFN